MSQAEWLAVIEQVRAQEQLYLAQVEKSKMRDEADALAQMKFILSLRPIGPLSGFLEALDTLKFPEADLSKLLEVWAEMYDASVDRPAMEAGEPEVRVPREGYN